MNKKILVGIIFSFVSCASMDKAMTGTGSMPAPEERPAIAEKLGLSGDQKAKFVAGEVWIGMTMEHLNAHLGGAPKKAQKKLTSSGNKTFAIYASRVGNWKTGIVTKYFKATMIEGKLTEFQELDADVGSLDQL